MQGPHRERGEGRNSYAGEGNEMPGEIDWWGLAGMDWLGKGDVGICWV